MITGTHKAWDFSLYSTIYFYYSVTHLGDLWPRFPAVPKMSDDGELVELDQLEEGGQVANLQSPDNNLSDDSDDDVSCFEELCIF